jgi:hypothetical protein
MKTWHKVLVALFSAGAAAVAIFVKNPQSQATAGKIEQAAAPIVEAALEGIDPAK